MDEAIYGAAQPPAAPKPAAGPAVKRRIGTGFNKRPAPSSAGRSQPAQAAAPSVQPGHSCSVGQGDQAEPSENSQQTCSAPLAERTVAPPPLRQPECHAAHPEHPAGHDNSRVPAVHQAPCSSNPQQRASTSQDAALAGASGAAPGSAFEGLEQLDIDEDEAVPDGLDQQGKSPQQEEPGSRCRALVLLGWRVSSCSCRVVTALNVRCRERPSDWKRWESGRRRRGTGQLKRMFSPDDCEEGGRANADTDGLLEVGCCPAPATPAGLPIMPEHVSICSPCACIRPEVLLCPGC